MSEKRLRAGITGMGQFAPEFAPFVAEFMDVVAISSHSEASRNDFVKQTGYDIQQFDTPVQLMDEVKPDVLVICSANFLHKDVTLAAAERGVHVFCEKPMTNSLVPDCWEMVQACEKAGVRLMVGHKRRLRPPWSRMVELKEQLGKPLAITACGYHDGVVAYKDYFRGWWRKQETSGGLLPVIGVHIIDWMLSMAGEVATVRAQTTPHIDPGWDYPVTMHVELTFRSGTIASMPVSLSYVPMKFRQSSGPMVVCENGGLRMIPDPDHIDIHWQRNDDKELHCERFDDLGHDHAYRLECGDFARWVQDENFKPCLTWEEGLRVVEVMEAANRSAEAGGKVLELPLYPELERSP